MTIYMNKETGNLTIGHSIRNYDNYEVLTPQEVLKLIDEAPSWDYYDWEIWEALGDELDVDVSKFDDPDKLFEALSDRA